MQYCTLNKQDVRFSFVYTFFNNLHAGKVVTNTSSLGHCDRHEKYIRSHADAGYCSTLLNFPFNFLCFALHSSKNDSSSYWPGPRFSVTYRRNISSHLSQNSWCFKVSSDIHTLQICLKFSTKISITGSI